MGVNKQPPADVKSNETQLVRFSGQPGKLSSGPWFGTHVLHGIFPVANSESIITDGQLIAPVVGTVKGMFLGAHQKTRTPV